MIMAKCTGVRCPMQYGYKVEECNHTDCPYRTEPITNADRIRAMTDEELAHFLAWHWNKKYWNQIWLNSDVSDSLLRQLIDHAWDEVNRKLPLKQRIAK